MDLCTNANYCSAEAVSSRASLQHRKQSGLCSVNCCLLDLKSLCATNVVDWILFLRHTFTITASKANILPHEFGL